MSTPHRAPISAAHAGLATSLVLAGGAALGQQVPPTAPPAETAPSGSLLVAAESQESIKSGDSHRLRDISMFALVSPEARIFQKHDLIQIVVRETSFASRRHRLDLEKDWKLDGNIAAWPDFRIDELLQLMIRAGRTTDLPSVDINVGKEFEGDGWYRREDDFTARLTAEVMEVLPNGNLVLEARTEIITDEERGVLKATGICRAEDVTPANTILSSQLHDLKVHKEHTGELKRTNKKGIIAKVLDTIFAF